jgi:hypothetical protein
MMIRPLVLKKTNNGMNLVRKMKRKLVWIILLLRRTVRTLHQTFLLNICFEVQVFSTRTAD